MTTPHDDNGLAYAPAIRDYLHEHPDKLQVVKDWVAALRSGQYQQGKSRLVTVKGQDREHCCLGVLTCMVAEKYGLDERIVAGNIAEDFGIVAFGEHFDDSLLPQLIADDLFLGNVNPFVGREGYRSSLSNLNDRGMTFNEIADLIEKTYVEPGEEVGNEAG